MGSITLMVIGFAVILLSANTSELNIKKNGNHTSTSGPTVSTDQRRNSQKSAPVGLNDQKKVVNGSKTQGTQKKASAIRHAKASSLERNVNRKGTRRRRNPKLDDVVISKHFTERTLAPGADVSLLCIATGNKPSSITWRRDGSIITPNMDPRYAIGQVSTDEGVVSHFNISKVHVNDGGLFSCSASPFAVHEDRLNVYGPPYIRNLPPIKARNRESISIRCPYYGFPISKVEWEHKGKILSMPVIEPREQYQGHVTKRSNQNMIVSMDGTLTIEDIVKEEESPLYTCIVHSPSGEMARRSFEIIVVEAPELEELYLAPNIQEGQIVQLHCNVKTGDTPIHFTWLKDGKPIPALLKVTERNLDTFSSLSIKKVGLEHCGTYTCIASNNVAKVNKTVDLFIKVGPKWVQEPKNSSFLLGRSGLVNCETNGYPQPNVHWMKRDSILGIWQSAVELSSGVIVVLPNGSLYFDQVRENDEAEYSCNVENGVGHPLIKNIWITVNKPVHFESLASNITTKIGQTTKIRCEALGDEPIRVTWTHNGKIVPHYAHRTRVTDNKTTQGVASILTLQYVETSDAGIYQCSAVNAYNTEYHTVYLTVLAPPPAPIDLRVDTTKSRSVKLSWRDMRSVQVLWYTIQWLQSNYQTWEYALSLNVTRREEIMQWCELTSLKPATSYSARVAAGNQADLSPYTAPVYFTTYDDLPSSPPLAVQVDQTQNPGELRVTWTEPPIEAHNGLLLGYYIQAVPQITDFLHGTKDLATLSKVPAHSAKLEATLQGLLKNTRYAVSVSAYNSAGKGPFSAPMHQDTREGAPEHAPLAIECTGMSPTSVRVGWQPIPITGQSPSLIGYNILYSTEDSEWMNKTSLQTEKIIQHLAKYTNYTVKVAAFSSYGLGPFSSSIVCTTLQDIPGPPAGIKLLAVSETALLVSWKKPKYPNGEITHYNIYLRPATSNHSPEILRVEAYDATDKTKTLELNDLVPGKLYEAWATAWTLAGEGSPTEKATRAPLAKAPAGVASIGCIVRASVGSSVLLLCQCVGFPTPRTAWYLNNNIISLIPRYTRNHDDSILIHNIDIAISGNYTCIAKNIHGTDQVTYKVIVEPPPPAPVLRAIPFKWSLEVSWDQPYGYYNSGHKKISYNLTWREDSGPWCSIEELYDTYKYTLNDLKCGTKYSLRITASNKIGTSQAAYLDIKTLGGVAIPPKNLDWFWSNSTDIIIQMHEWNNAGCEMLTAKVDYRPLGSVEWQKVSTSKGTYNINTGWSNIASKYGKDLRPMPNSFRISNLRPATWYQVKVVVVNEAGTVSMIYQYATKTENGAEIEPPFDIFDINGIIIMSSIAFVTVCGVAALCLYYTYKRQVPATYGESVTTELKSESGNLAGNQSNTNLAIACKELPQAGPCPHSRVYSDPVPVPSNSKHEMYDVSPYAQFTVGFKTFGHLEGQQCAPRGLPRTPCNRYITQGGYCVPETSFNGASDSDDSDNAGASTSTGTRRNPRRHYNPHMTPR